MEIEKMSNKLIKVFNKAYVDKQNQQMQQQQQYFQYTQQQQQYYQTAQQPQPSQQNQNREYTVKSNNYKSWFYDPSHQSGR